MYRFDIGGVFRNEKQKTQALAWVLNIWCGWRDLNPHVIAHTATSTLPVYQFQHIREDVIY